MSVLDVTFLTGSTCVILCQAIRATPYAYVGDCYMASACAQYTRSLDFWFTVSQDILKEEVIKASMDGDNAVDCRYNSQPGEDLVSTTPKCLLWMVFLIEAPWSENSLSQ